jgi:glycosyltransferase involved in cell wall biosynthesis
MRSLHFCWEYPPVGAGIGMYMAEIASGLRKLGHFTVIVTSRVPGQPEEELLDNGLICRVYEVEDIGSPWVADRVLALARLHKVDFIEVADHLGEGAALLKKGDRPPVLVNCRYNDVVRKARYAQAWYGWQRWMIDLACLREHRRLDRERYSITHADMLAAPSQWMMDGLKEEGLTLPAKRAVLPKPLAAVPGWTNEEADVPTLLLVGRIDIGKGVGYLKNLLRRIAIEVPDVQLEIAGGDSYARGLGSLMRWTKKQLGDQQHRVTFLGSCAPPALDDAFKRAWVVILPSRWDTSPTVLLEAMVRSKAVVSSPFGGMPEYVAGTDAPIADPGTPAFAQAVVSLLKNQDAREKVGTQLCERAVLAYQPIGAAEQFVEFVETHTKRDL